jgi:cytochrome P450
MKLLLHPNAERLLGKDNFVFLHGIAHRIIRHRLLRLFTKERHEVYIRLQERTIREHLVRWEEMSAREGPRVGPQH